MMRDSAGSFLLPRSSEDSPISTPDSFSEIWDDSTEVVKPKRRRSLLALVQNGVGLLSSRPLGYRLRRKLPHRRYRALLCLVINLISVVAISVVAFSLADAIFVPSYSNPPKHYKQLQDRVKTSGEIGSGNVRNEKIFIAANIIQHDLIRGSWGQSLLQLIDHLGPQNVFVSIYENDSGLETPLALAELRSKLKCEHSMVYGDHLPLSKFPTVVLPNGDTRVKRITYLSEVRNRLLRPLDEPSRGLSKEYDATNHTSTRFDKILFLNDIYFKPIDALQLLFSTNQDPETQQSNYQAACAIDFIRGGIFYDSFVVRDTDGYEISWFLYPWFTAMGSGTTRGDVLAGKDAVRVSSCWGGMAAFEATPFLRQDVIKKINHNHFPGGHLSPVETQPPLRFRHQSDLYWEASECCLLHADLFARHPGIESNIFINPFVRVAYDAGTWNWMRVIQRFERLFSTIQYWLSRASIKYERNPRRTEAVGRPARQLRWIYDRDEFNGERFHNLSLSLPLPLPLPLPTQQDTLTGRWVRTEEIAQPGGFCGQKRLFYMLPDLQKANAGKSGKNWEKASIPSNTIPAH